MATEGERKAALKKKIEYQVACEERAFRIVEKLIDNPVSEQYFVDSLQYITSSHYQDIIEERAVSKLCGYPLCPATLGNVPKQKYFISTKTNKVYDIEACKNFCSAKCYKVSNYVEKQISTDPVWTRKGKARQHIELLPLDPGKGLLGDEIVISKKEEMRKEVEKLEKVDKYEERLKKRQVDNHPGGKDTHKAHDGADADKCVYDLDKAMDEMMIGQETKSGDKIEQKTKSGDKIEQETKTGDKIEQETKSGDKIEQETKSGDKIEQKTKADIIEEFVCRGSVGGSAIERLEIQIPDTDASAGIDEPRKPQVFQTAVKMGKKNVSKGKSDTKAGVSKTEYLMQLLDKRKSLLAKMVDIQEPSVAAPDNVQKPVIERVSVVDAAEQTENNTGAVIAGGIDSDKQKDAGVAERTLGTDAISSEKEKVTVVSVKVQEISRTSSDHRHTVGTEPKNTKENTEREKIVKKKTTKKVKKSRGVITLEFVAKTFQTWLTQKSLDYLREGDEDVVEEESVENPEKKAFNRQYKALVAKVDAQEKEFDEDLLGEMKMDDTCPGPSAPTPDYSSLKHEAGIQQLKVREFMKGSFTYKPDRDPAAQAESQTSIKLPTVDRYDQLVLRQKIALERISKVLPDLLTPLNLLIQEVYTEVKEFVIICNLTSENIVFKPAEWMMVTLLMLKMLSMRMMKVHEAFKSSRAQTYFKTILSGIGATLGDVDVLVTQLMQGCHDTGAGT